MLELRADLKFWQRPSHFPSPPQPLFALLVSLFCCFEERFMKKQGKISIEKE